MALTEWVSGESVSWWQLPRAVSIVAGLATVITGFVVSSLWRLIWRCFPAMNKVVFPDLNGEWRGDLHSNWVDQETGQRVSPKEVVLTISQSWWDFSVRLITDQARSFSTRIYLEREPGRRVFRVWYAYGHRPRPEFRPGNPPHEGMAYLEYDANEPNELYGQYFTDRETTGSFVLKRRRSAR